MGGSPRVWPPPASMGMDPCRNRLLFWAALVLGVPVAGLPAPTGAHVPRFQALPARSSRCAQSAHGVPGSLLQWSLYGSTAHKPPQNCAHRQRRAGIGQEEHEAWEGGQGFSADVTLNTRVDRWVAATGRWSRERVQNPRVFGRLENRWQVVLREGVHCGEGWGHPQSCPLTSSHHALGRAGWPGREAKTTAQG